MRKFLKDIRLKINRIGNTKRKEKIRNQKLTLISNNCWAGIVYEHFGLPFNSPTIGLFIMPKDYIKFCKDLKKYLETELRFISIEESKYFGINTVNLKGCIIGKIDDIEIFFLHYKTKEEVLEKWNRRKKRVNFENIILKFNDQNGCTYDDIKQFDNLEYEKKICFTSKKYDQIKCNIWLKKYRKQNFVKEDYYSCYKYIDLLDFINNGGKNENWDINTL